MKITTYTTQTAASSHSQTVIDTSTSSESSFEDVLVLNQTALKAMTIDSMIAESPTGSISPDSVDAAAILKFRNTLTNVVAPIPEDTVSQNTSTQKNTEEHNDSSVNTNDSVSTNSSSNHTSISSSNHTSIDTSDVYNSGSLVCNDELNSYFKEAADFYQIDVKLLKAIAKAESNFNPSTTSSSGAMGIMQLMPNTAKTLGVTNAYDAKECIMGGAQYISSKLNTYNGDITLALAAYNAGSGNVKKYGGVPPFTETQNYIRKVLGYYYESC